ncbi:NitT/TauT family transport system substrate-binding protein [Hydrogenoanaerobacterium saccharovorans]|uniref:NitT/TauT family transport system substrate-binding protein n=1 Tax=Hydrogenoanaerobacterium saccharovorans TaxID=474960 RepID=A0A1H8BDP7_9FIRM|nr:MqnA/MqnD/SBP family protein [Hydrogenoanaerobacterium saccharovorans]RPF47458.1 NitT/TauT family transport system substrate-binding protein [Hydrogenoanaerobacterium saccharovorans]SEM81091.1 NitT/TauT family transport system substrate-binding protein [Hydrogenoanaerobacterium saccharovorans]
MKKILAIAIALVLVLSITACGQKSSSSEASSVPPSQPAPSSEPASAEKIDVKIAALKGPTAMGMVKLMDDTANGKTANNYVFTLAGAPDELVGSIIKGEYDIAAVPTNLSATLYNKTQGKVKLAALNTMGVLYVVENGNTIQSIADLKGKTIYSTGKGATPEFALNYVLEKNGLKVGTDVTVEYKTEHTELANMLAAGQAEIALLPQPFVTSVLMQNEKVRIALDLTKEWDTATKGESGLTMGCIVVQQKFMDEHPDALKAFLEEYKTSAAFITDSANLDAAAELVVKQNIIPKLPMAKKAIPQCSIVYVEGDEMKKIASGFLKVLFDANPQSVGGKLPDENFYYIAQ